MKSSYKHWSLSQGDSVLGNVLWFVFSALCTQEEVRLRWIFRGIREVFSENKRVCVYMTQTVPVLTTNIHWRELEYGRTAFILSPLFTVTIPTVQNVYHVNVQPMFRNNVTIGSSSNILKWNVILCLVVWIELKHTQTDQEFQLRFLLINHRSSWNPIQYHDRDILSLDLWTKWDKFW